MDNPGKAMGAKAAVVKLKDCLITRCDTGGELVETLAQIRTSHFLDMPSEHGVFVDDDNDCLYLKGEYVDGSGDKPASLVEGCVFAVGKDDGIDHNGANVVVNDCSMEGFAHEGIACSGGGRIEIRNTLARQNEQGIEAGYGEPDVVVDHCVVTDNDVGFRYGDSYDWEVTGHLAVTNSISFGNQKHNVWNWVNLLDGPAADALDISYSMVDDPEWDGQAHNLAGQPVFDDAWRLAPGSPGVGKGSDGQDIGLLPE
jgi:hypothetical protein